MDTKEILIVCVLVLICILGFKPAVNNFLVVLKDKYNPKVSRIGRKFVLSYLALGIVAIIFMFSICAYTLVSRL